MLNVLAKPLALELWYNLVLSFCCKGFWQTLELRKMSHCWSLKGTGASYKETFVSTDNCLQNEFGKTEKIRQILTRQILTFV